MKEPEGHEASANDYEPSCCVEDGSPWPCKTWRKWTASKDYRIKELEAGLKAARENAARIDARLRAVENTVREDSNILRNGIFRAMADLGKEGRMGNLALNWSREAEDFTTLGQSHRVRVAGPVDLIVKYVDIDGRTWTDGVVTDQVLRGG
ncbi:hypothetical protein [Streptomyces sp. NBC_00687]|uniref:hypothetical protein n=1 Tax=Streptomyces sp. NBC_00687 TaxID=2975807 RepID=UPI00224F76F6|nr:hypothetical protein [Streptomyces sp. NBC_00687]MCX4912856.1 hypothetical protein [Streptomyces sp. NBC_00687]